MSRDRTTAPMEAPLSAKRSEIGAYLGCRIATSGWPDATKSHFAVFEWPAPFLNSNVTEVMVAAI